MKKAKKHTTPPGGGKKSVKVGSNVLINTVGPWYLGRLVEDGDRWLLLEDAAAVLHIKEWDAPLVGITLSRVDPYPAGLVIRVATAAVVGMMPWTRELPQRRWWRWELEGRQ